MSLPEPLLKARALRRYLQQSVTANVLIDDTLFTTEDNRQYRILDDEELEELIAEQTKIRNDNWFEDTEIECPCPGGRDIMMQALELFIDAREDCTPWDAVTAGQRQSGEDFVIEYEDDDGEEYRWHVFPL